MVSAVEELKRAIRDVPDFPKPGILFKDLAPLLGRGDLFKRAIDQISERYQNQGVEQVLVIESRGFLVGAPIAYRLGAGIIPIRKKGKLPWKTVGVTYQLEYGADTLEMHADALNPGTRVIVVDDLLATGGTARATCQLAEKLRGRVMGCAFLVELTFLKGRNALHGFDVFSLIQF